MARFVNSMQSSNRPAVLCLPLRLYFIHEIKDSILIVQLILTDYLHCKKLISALAIPLF
jgi:hypothetical protein